MGKRSVVFGAVFKRCDYGTRCQLVRRVLDGLDEALHYADDGHAPGIHRQINRVKRKAKESFGIEIDV